MTALPQRSPRHRCYLNHRDHTTQQKTHSSSNTSDRTSMSIAVRFGPSASNQSQFPKHPQRNPDLPHPTHRSTPVHPGSDQHLQPTSPHPTNPNDSNPRIQRRPQNSLQTTIHKTPKSQPICAISGIRGSDNHPAKIRALSPSPKNPRPKSSKNHLAAILPLERQQIAVFAAILPQIAAVTARSGKMFSPPRITRIDTQKLLPQPNQRHHLTHRLGSSHMPT